MRTYRSFGTICVKGPYNLVFALCDIEYILKEDDSFRYVFKPNYNVIELLDSKYFQGIPGLNLDLKEKEYIRDNMIPTFISERVPMKNREDYNELLELVGMDYMDPIEYLISYGLYFGADLFKNIGTIISSTELLPLATYINIFFSAFGLVLPVMVLIDLIADKDKSNNPKNKKTDWFYTNEQYDRKLDDRADKNNYRTL